MSVRAGHRDMRRKDSMEVRVIFFVCFIPSLAAIAAGRLLRGREPKSRSVVSEAKAAAYNCVSFAFMG